MFLMTLEIWRFPHFEAHLYSCSGGIYLSSLHVMLMLTRSLR